ncbi:MAG: ABC transporter ATP-binding protein [Clostridium sp.]
MEKILEIKGLNKYYKKHHVLKNIDLTIYEGEIVGFIGPNGAGKSTTMKCINNLIFPTSGSIKVCGYDLMKDRDKALLCQASLIENPGLYLDMTGYDNLKIFAGLRNVSKERLEEIAKFTNLKDALKKKVSQYSLGMKQRLALGIVLLNKPKLIILDEPTNGLDPRGVMELRKTLIDLVEKEEVSILFSSHILGEIEKIATRIVCIHNGEIVDVPETLHDAEQYNIKTSNNELANEIIASLKGKLTIIDNDYLSITFHQDLSLKQVLKALIDADIDVIDVQKEAVNIESIYTAIYGD